jgi:hypothetical protein
MATCGGGVVPTLSGCTGACACTEC